MAEKEPIAKELDQIKRLLALLLLKLGTSHNEIATALGVSRPTVSRMFPARGIKKIKSAE